jgi:hypothetical protein
MPTENNRNEAEATKPASTDDQIGPTFVRSPDFRSIYTNFVQSAYTPYDISLMLGETAGLEDGRWLVENKARLIMSPPEAKVVLIVLQGAIENYERVYGEIKPPQVIKGE